MIFTRPFSKCKAFVCILVLYLFLQVKQGSSSSSCNLYGRGGQITAGGPDPARRSISSGPIVIAETTAIASSLILNKLLDACNKLHQSH